MKKLRKIAGVFLGVALVAASAMTAWAENPPPKSVSLYLPTGDQASIQFNGNETSFFDFDNVVPGDTLICYISIENKRSETVTFYMNATNGSISEDLLRNITMVIANEDTGRTIYSGNMTGRPVSIYGGDFYKNSTDQINGVNLGTYRPYATVRLKVTLYVPLRVDNDFADVMGKVVWQLRAQLPDTTTSSSSSSGSSSSYRTTSTRDQDRGRDTTPDDLYRITDNDVPLAGEPYKIADNQIPLAELPKTGGLPLGFMGVAAAGAGGGVLLAGRKKDS